MIIMTRMNFVEKDEGTGESDEKTDVTPDESTNSSYSEIDNSYDNDSDEVKQNGSYAECDFSKPLNQSKDSSDARTIFKPSKITNGCWVKVLEIEKKRKIIYNIPLKNDKQTMW